MSESLEDALSQHPFLSGLPEGTLELVASCAQLVTFETGSLLLTEGGVATTLYLVYRGRVAIEIHTPTQDRLRIETVEPGQVVGLSWAAPPFRWQFDARALEPVAAVAIDSARLRDRLGENPAVGYALLGRLLSVVLKRLQATRASLIDLHQQYRGGGHAGERRRSRSWGAPEPVAEDLEDVLSRHRFLSGLPEGTVELLVSCAKLATFEAGSLLLSEGGVADTLYLLYRGRAAIEIHGPAQDRLIIETVEPGEVTGLSWAAPPFRWQFDTRALEPVATVAIDSERLRARLGENPVVGYALLGHLSSVVLKRLQATRFRLIDLYGGGSEQSDFVTGAAPRSRTLTPSLYHVVGRTEVADVVTLALEPYQGRSIDFLHGQFNMLTAFGIGEVAISISSTPGAPGPIEHSVRDVGAVSHALCSAPVGTVVGVRGPFGTPWGVDDIEEDSDVVVVAGGIGLAPLRGAIDDLVRRRRAGGGRVFLLFGARSPDQILFAEDLEAWRRSGAHVDVTVDVGAPGWDGPVGLVTALLPNAPFAPAHSVALLCGPEIMIRFAARDLVDLGVDPRRIRVSLERNMQCGVGLCGHCQLGPLLVCRDGPVVPWGGVADELFMQRQR